MWRPSDEEFMAWAEDDGNAATMRNALMEHPDLIAVFEVYF